MKIYSLLDLETAISALNVPSQADLHDPVVFFGHHEKGRNIKNRYVKSPYVIRPPGKVFK